MYQETESYTKLSKDAKNNYNAAWEKSTSGRRTDAGKNVKDTVKRLSILSDRKVRDLNGLDYQKVIDGIKAEGLGRDSCEKVRSLISVLCQHAILMQVIDQNYANTLKLPEQGARAKRRNFTYDEILTLLYNDQHRDVQILLCLIYSGVRENELFKMRKENVHLSPDRNYMVGGSKSEAGKDRIIPIRSEIIEYITGFYNTGDSPYLILDDNGQRLNRSSYIKKYFYPLLDRLKFDYRNEKGDSLLVPYRSRHTFIAENIKAGVKPEILTKLVGHANYSTSVNKYDEYIDIDYIIKEAQKGL
ncbi:MAG: site-specific integrase [Angelakisella sp.]